MLDTAAEGMGWEKFRIVPEQRGKIQPKSKEALPGKGRAFATFEKRTQKSRG
jgi:hypothetical protein